MIKTLKAIALAALAFSGAAQAVVVNKVDLFTTNQAKLTDNTVNGAAVTSQVGSGVDTSILGGYRELFIDLKAQDSGNPDLVGTIGVFNGKLNFSTDTGAAATGTARWDGFSTGPNINATGLGAAGVGFANALTDSFELNVVFSDGGFEFVLEAYTDAANWSKVKILSNAHPTPTTTFIPLAAFLDCTNAFPVPGVSVQCSGAGVDFNNLGALQAVIDPNGTFTSLDLTLAKAVVVPEPGALALVGLALAVASVASRRRKA